MQFWLKIILVRIREIKDLQRLKLRFLLCSGQILVTFSMYNNIHKKELRSFNGNVRVLTASPKSDSASAGYSIQFLHILPMFLFMQESRQRRDSCRLAAAIVSLYQFFKHSKIGSIYFLSEIS